MGIAGPSPILELGWRFPCPGEISHILLAGCEGTQGTAQALCWPQRRLGLLFLGSFTSCSCVPLRGCCWWPQEVDEQPEQGDSSVHLTQALEEGEFHRGSGKPGALAVP